MALSNKRLGASRPADTNNATLYTVPTGVSVVVTAIRICNTTGTAATARLFLVPSGGTADQSTAIYYDYSVPANSTIADDGKHVLEAGGTIQVRVGTGSAITFTASGVEVS